MNFKFQKFLSRLHVLATFAITVQVCASYTWAERVEIDRYKVDFIYQGVHYNILSEIDKTVAVAQPYDIDLAPTPHSFMTAPYLRDDVDANGFLMADGLMGPVVVIPSTVFDPQGNSYTVTDIADYAINWVGIKNLILPPTLKNLNDGILSLNGLTSLYLSEGLTEISGISYCRELKNLQIPWNVKAIRKYSLHNIGLAYAYLPPSVQSLEDFVLASCDSLELVTLSGVKTMGAGCFSECQSFIWANLPETLRTMGEGCFNDCPSLELVSLPWTEIKMEGCFNGCPAINRIEVLAIDPNPFPERSFLDVDRSLCELAVPVGSKEKYQNAEGWKDFINIVEDIPAVEGMATASLRSMDLRVLGGKGMLTIISPIGIEINVFTLSGERVATVSKSGVSHLQLSAGVYIVSSLSGSRKVSVS